MPKWCSVVDAISALSFLLLLALVVSFSQAVSPHQDSVYVSPYFSYHSPSKLRRTESPNWMEPEELHSSCSSFRSIFLTDKHLHLSQKTMKHYPQVPRLSLFILLPKLMVEMFWWDGCPWNLPKRWFWQTWGGGDSKSATQSISGNSQMRYHHLVSIAAGTNTYYAASAYLPEMHQTCTIHLGPRFDSRPHGSKRLAKLLESHIFFYSLTFF